MHLGDQATTQASGPRREWGSATTPGGVDPYGYLMAVLLREALDSGAPPSMARLPMTPEEVAAAYDAAEAEEDTRAAVGAAKAVRS
jgi:hypothetical protein